MKPFRFQQGAAAWPPEVSLLHVYVTVDRDQCAELIRLVDGGQAAIAGYPISVVLTVSLGPTRTARVGPTGDRQSGSVTV